MTTINFTDRVPMGEVRRTADGYLVTDARVARTGIQVYLGSELGRPDLSTVRVYRPESAVFAADAMRSYAHRPVTLGHRGTVTAKNWRDVAAGSTGGEVVRDGEFVRVPLSLMDQAAIDAYDAGTRELSMGYDANLEFTDGKTPEGEAYDAIISGMQMNHLALVDQARGGQSLRIGDAGNPEPVNHAHQNGGHNMAEKTVVVDGISILTTDQGAQALEKVQRQLADALSTAKMSDADHAKQLAERDVKIQELSTKVLTDAQIDARVARTLHDADYKGKADAEIRRAAVAVKMGDAAVAGKSDDYVAAAFDMLASNVGKIDPLTAALRDGKPAPAAGDNGQAAYQARLNDAWKTPK
jgi:hypothetical protein